jgi:transcriptional regulator with GAF, ATPase, and Fis domain
LESELFGYEGRFTGATDSKPGRFSGARRDDCADEIASLISARKQLLRVIEERNFERLRGKQSISIDVRIVALANVDEEAVRARASRDVFTIVWAVVSIELPRLVDRNDLPNWLAVCQTVRVENGRRSQVFTRSSPSGRARFSGNVRELRNIAEQAVLKSDGEMTVYIYRTTRGLRRVYAIANHAVACRDRGSIRRCSTRAVS